MRQFVRRVLVSCFVVGSYAASAAAPVSMSTCDAEALNSAEYARSIDAVRRLPELIAWSRSHAFPVAFGDFADKQVTLEGSCYWSVSVYANRPERLELWNVFYVETKAKAKGQRLLVQDFDSGGVISLKAWRSNTEKS